MIKNRRRRIASQAGSGAPTQLLNLSLFIMLLAFFIVLNALSSFEEVKSRPVMESLDQAFSSKIVKRDILPSSVPDPVKSINEGDTVDRLDALFKAQISAFEATKSKSRGIMHVKLPLDEFSKAIMAVGQDDLTETKTITASKKFFLPTLISILKSDQAGAPYRMDVVINVSENPANMQNLNPEEMDRIIDRVGQFSRKLERAGMPQNLLSVGLQKGPEDEVEIFFRRHEPFPPSQSTEEQLQNEEEAAR